jgi:hypothetical protein
MLASFGVYAQLTVHGTVYDSLTHIPLRSVSIEDLQTHKGCFSDSNGNFQLEVRIGDALILTRIGYARRIYILRNADDLNHLTIYLQNKNTNLKAVVITRGLTEYQKDSANRAEIYQDAIGYEQQKSMMSPVTSLYQKFSKKYKELRKFQGQIVDMEKQKFIDTRYTPELVHAMTKLDEDAMAEFMNQYPMDYDYARAASDLEIKMWIKYNYQDYLKKGKPSLLSTSDKKN